MVGKIIISIDIEWIENVDIKTEKGNKIVKLMLLKVVKE